MYIGTQGSVTDSLPALWQEYEFVTSMTKVIKEKQGATPLPLPDRREKFDAFEKWLAEYKAIYTDQVWWMYANGLTERERGRGREGERFVNSVCTPSEKANVRQFCAKY